ncbi:MAG: hypothetical protein R3330_10080, partial [Saprospiraceae bacterium]|nr:hypothetical protein [Saprospiraceae bacterium]
RKKGAGGITLHEPFGSYLHRLCKWLWLNELKKRKRLSEVNHAYSTTMAGQDNPDDPDRARQRHEDATFRQAFEALGILCQQILRLSWTGLNLKQIGQKLGKSYGYLRRKRPECVRAFVRTIKQAEE